VIFERDEVLTQGGTPFSVFTPYKNAWLKRLTPADLNPARGRAPCRGTACCRPSRANACPTLAELGFEATDLAALRLPAGMSGAQAMFRDFADRIDDYAAKRDFPAQKGCSYLSAHLRFGTISIRQLAAYAHGQRRSRRRDLAVGADLARLLPCHPVAPPARRQRSASSPNSMPCAGMTRPKLLAAWQEGRTGYPLVDAAMRQLVQAGWMHNRLRMVAASFLTKDLGLDWRLGEAWFAEKLLDFDLAANNGGWQWAASTGCDAQPWFRIFNPVTQSEKFDADGRFIRRYVPELAAVPAKFIHAPWTMDAGLQSSGALADHALARRWHR
jgi:deoxyribodipyrimidine photo-lyase